MLEYIQSFFAMVGIIAACAFLYSLQKVPLLQYLWGGIYVIFYYAFGVAYPEVVMALIMAISWMLYYFLGVNCLLVLVPLMVMTHIWALLFGPYPKIRGQES